MDRATSSSFSTEERESGRAGYGRGSSGERKEESIATRELRNLRGRPFADEIADGGRGGEGGFFAMPEEFPSLSALGAEFESMKIPKKRTKRSAQPQPQRFRRFQQQQQRPRRRRAHQGYEQRGGPRQRRYHNQPREQPHHRRQDNFEQFKPDFWTEDVESDFFTHSGRAFGTRNQPYGDPPRNVNRQRNNHNQGYDNRNPHHQYHDEEPQYEYEQPREQHSPRHRQREYETVDDRRNYYIGRDEGPASRHRDPYPEQSIANYPREDGYRQQQEERNVYWRRQQQQQRQQDEEAEKARSYQEEVDNAILGSGNFDVIKGGTFYDPDVYYNTRYNTRPQNYGEYGNEGGDFLENFRDFADIKQDLYRYPQRRY